MAANPDSYSCVLQLLSHEYYGQPAMQHLSMLAALWRLSVAICMATANILLVDMQNWAELLEGGVA